MKVAQLLATIPDALPAEYANELMKLQSQAPPMGWAFVKRRMSAELGAGWEKKFKSFEHHPAAAASLGQVHRARARARRRRAGLQAAISRHAVGGRSRPQSVATAVLDPQTLRSGDRRQRDRGRDRGTPARGARLCARGKARRALSADAERRGQHPRARGLARAFDRAPAHHGLDERPQAARAQGRSARHAQSARHRHVHRLVVPVQPLRRHPRRPASRQLHGF